MVSQAPVYSLQGQQQGQRDQRAHTLDLLQQRHLWIAASEGKL
jgi:hypothetical protein